MLHKKSREQILLASVLNRCTISSRIRQYLSSCRFCYFFPDLSAGRDDTFIREDLGIEDCCEGGWGGELVMSFLDRYFAVGHY